MWIFGNDPFIGKALSSSSELVVSFSFCCNLSPKGAKSPLTTQLSSHYKCENHSSCFIETPFNLCLFYLTPLAPSLLREPFFWDREGELLRMIISLDRGNVVFHNIPKIRIKKKIIIRDNAGTYRIESSLPCPRFQQTE